MPNKKYPHKICRFCIDGVREEDLSVGIPEHYICDNPYVPEKVYDVNSFGNPTKDCPDFAPIMHEKCDVCGRTINIPLWLWDKVYPGMAGDVVCCSDLCLENARKTEEQLREED